MKKVIVEDELLIREVKTLLKPRDFKILVPHFPPFTNLLAKSEPYGPLVQMFELFAEMLETPIEFERMASWDHTELISSGRAISIAAPIYAQPRMPLPVCCFCELGTCYIIVNKEFSKFDEFRAKLGYVYARWEIIQAEMDESRGSSTILNVKGICDTFNNGTSRLRKLVRELLETTKMKHFAVPDQHAEADMVHDFAFDSPKRIEVTADKDVLAGIKEYADAGYVVLCNSVARGLFLKTNSPDEYFSEPLLQYPFPVLAGIPFALSDEKLSELFRKFLSSGDGMVEHLLTECASDGTAILPANDRRVMTMPSSGLNWSALQSRSRDNSEFLLGAYDSIKSELKKPVSRKILNGTVIQVDSLSDGSFAEVLFEEGGLSRVKRIEASRLKAIDMAYIGAQLKYIVSECEGTRLITLEPHEEANDQQREKNEALIREILAEDSDDDA